jgi:CBS domain-containing protein
MRCDEAMSEDVRSAEPNETVRAAAIRMRDENIGFLPVCDADGRVLGTLTDRDIATRVAAAGLSAADCLVGDVMTPEVVFVQRDADLTEAEQLMGREKKARIIVVDEAGRMCGVISLSDLATFDEPRRVGETLRERSTREART